MTKKKIETKSVKQNKKDEPLQEQKKDNKDIKADKALIFAIIILVGIFLIFIITIKNSVNNPIVEPPEELTVNYSGFTFQKIGNSWNTILNIAYGTDSKNFEVSFHYNPYQVEDIPTIKDLGNNSAPAYFLKRAQHVYITMDPEYPGGVILSGVEIAKILGNVYFKPVNATLTRPDPAGSHAQIITCENVTKSIGVVELRLGDETRIMVDKGCVIVQGTTVDELLRAAEKLSFELLKIM